MTDQLKMISSSKRMSLAVVVFTAASVAAGLVYGIASFSRNPADAACGPALATAQRIEPLARGEMAAVAVTAEPRLLPPLVFYDATGTRKALSDFRGRLILLNLWATWCVPCRQEMPALDALQAKLGGNSFEVVAVNIDTRHPEKPRAWLRDAGIRKLAYYADPSARVFQELKAVGKAVGMPTTLLVDPSGCELASLSGPAEWASEDAIRLMRAALNAPSP